MLFWRATTARHFVTHMWRHIVANAVLESNYSNTVDDNCIETIVANAVLESNYSSSGAAEASL